MTADPPRTPARPDGLDPDVAALIVALAKWRARVDHAREQMEHRAKEASVSDGQ